MVTAWGRWGEAEGAAIANLQGRMAGTGSELGLIRPGLGKAPNDRKSSFYASTSPGGIYALSKCHSGQTVLSPES